MTSAEMLPSHRGPNTCASKTWTSGRGHLGSVLPTGPLPFLFPAPGGTPPRGGRHPEVRRPARARHDALVREAIARHDGHVFKGMGDALYAVFALAPDALAAALA